MSGTQRRRPYLLPDDELLAECRVETFRSGGPGGQHANVTESGVRITHLPTGISASSRATRSQHRNRIDALETLRERLREHFTPRKKRIPTAVPRREKRARLEEKKRRGGVKKLRRNPPPED
jgi:peptide chain release factor 2